MSGYPSLQHLEPDELPSHALGFLPTQGLLAGEVSLVPGHGPPQRRFEHGGRLVHVVAVETHRRFESQGVSGSQPRRHQSG